MITEAQARQMFATAVDDAGGIVALAERLGYSRTGLCTVLYGRNGQGLRPIPPRVLEYLGLEKVEGYRRKK